MPKVIDQNLAEIENIVYNEFRQRQFLSLEKKRYGLLHVTDMVKPCVRNTYYNKLKVDGTKTYDTESMSHFFMGEAIHQLLDTVKVPSWQKETALYYNFVDDKSVQLFKKGTFELMPEVEKWSVKDWLKILVGEYDAMYVNADHNILVDYKTYQSRGYKKRSPNEDHITQLSIYRYLFNATHPDVDVEYGAVIYLDVDDKLSKPIIFVRKLATPVETRAMLITKYQQILDTYETGELPPRVKTWLCDGWCPYASRCFTENRVSKSENKLDVVL